MLVTCSFDRPFGGKELTKKKRSVTMSSRFTLATSKSSLINCSYDKMENRPQFLILTVRFPSQFVVLQFMFKTYKQKFVLNLVGTRCQPHQYSQSFSHYCFVFSTAMWASSYPSSYFSLVRFHCGNGSVEVGTSVWSPHTRGRVHPLWLEVQTNCLKSCTICCISQGPVSFDFTLRLLLLTTT